MESLFDMRVQRGGDRPGKAAQMLNYPWDEIVSYLTNYGSSAFSPLVRVEIERAPENGPPSWERLPPTPYELELVLSALRNASKALTNLDALAMAHDSVLLDKALHIMERTEVRI